MSYTHASFNPHTNLQPTPAHTRERWHLGKSSQKIQKHRIKYHLSNKQNVQSAKYSFPQLFLQVSDKK